MFSDDFSSAGDVDAPKPHNIPSSNYFEIMFPSVPAQTGHLLQIVKRQAFVKVRGVVSSFSLEDCYCTAPRLFLAEHFVARSFHSGANGRPAKENLSRGFSSPFHLEAAPQSVSCLKTINQRAKY